MPVRNEGDHDVPADLPGEAVGDPLFQPVADLDPDAPLLDREQNQDAAVFLLRRRVGTDAAAVILEQLGRVLTNVGVGSERRNRDHHDDIAAGGEERPTELVDSPCRRRVDHAGEIGERLGDLGQWRLLGRASRRLPGRACREHQDQGERGRKPAGP